MLLSLCAEVTDGFLSQKHSNVDLWCFFVVSLNKLSKKHSMDRLFETPWRSFDVTVIMMTSFNGNIFRVTGAVREESTGHRWIPFTKASDAELWCFLWSAPKQRLSKQSRRRWFETQSRSLWRHRNCQTWYGLCDYRIRISNYMSTWTKMILNLFNHLPRWHAD